MVPARPLPTQPVDSETWMPPWTPYRDPRKNRPSSESQGTGHSTSPFTVLTTTCYGQCLRPPRPANQCPLSGSRSLERSDRSFPMMYHGGPRASHHRCSGRQRRWTGSVPARRQCGNHHERAVGHLPYENSACSASQSFLHLPTCR